MADWTDGGHPEAVARKALRALSLDAYLAIGTIAAGLLAAMYVFGERLSLESGSAGAAFVIYAAIAAVALGNLGSHRHVRFGAANIVTTLRSAVTALIGGLVLASSTFGRNSDALWLVGAIVSFALTLDGIDGYLARRMRTASPFGARFDMEIDALTILFLSVAAVLLGKAGLWVLGIGLMRYIYGAARAVFPMLKGDLPPSMRRKAICVVQGVALCLMLFPIVVPPVSNLIGAGALALLGYSFATDVFFLIRANRGGHAP